MAKKKLSKWKVVFISFLFLIGIGIFLFRQAVIVTPDEVIDQTVLNEKRQTINDSTFSLPKGSLLKNDFGLWELYVEGSPFERGARIGILSEELISEQEYAFVDGMRAIVPNEAWLNSLKYIVAWQNRHLEDFVQEEFRKEIQGVSHFAEDEFDFIGPKYQRKLAYHAAHDIGHTLQNMGLVGGGCTTLSVWGKQAADSTLMLARNFDFYVGDDFAKNKVVYFVKPEKGESYVSISWPGLIGVVSGMNLSGLAVVLNAGPPAIPGTSKTPVSILAREILQYATTIQEAYEIAQKRKTFVSENIIIASAKDGRTVVIEKSPEQTVLLENEDKDASNLVCSNHFSTEVFVENEQNQKAQEATSTIHRFDRMTELLNQKGVLDVSNAIEILRDLKGVGGTKLGLGLEMALNQLQAHHAVVFKPEKLQVWISTQPWQLGSFVGYDLKEVFQKKALQRPVQAFYDPDLTIPEDSLIYSTEFANFLEYRTLQKAIDLAIQNEETVTNDQLDHFKTLNPEHFQTWLTLGRYYQMQEDCTTALPLFEKALTKALPWENDRVSVEGAIEDCKI